MGFVFVVAVASGADSCCPLRIARTVCGGNHRRVVYTVCKYQAHSIGVLVLCDTDTGTANWLQLLRLGGIYDLRL